MHPISYGKIWNYLLPITQNKESYWLYRTGLWDIGSMMLLAWPFCSWVLQPFLCKKIFAHRRSCIIIGLVLPGSGIITSISNWLIMQNILKGILLPATISSIGRTD